MNRLQSLVLACLLVAVLAVTGFAQSTPNLSALSTYNSPLSVCAVNAQFILQPSGGAYIGSMPGLYICPAVNTPLPFSQGANTLEIQGADFANATATATTFLSWPLNPYGVYKFACVVFWEHSSTVAPVFTLTTPTSPTNVLAFAQVYSTNTGTNTAGLLSGSPLAFTGAAAGAGSTVYKATVEGTIENGSTAGTLAFQLSSASGTVTAKRGSYCSLN